MDAVHKSDREVIEDITTPGRKREEALRHVFFELDWRGMAVRYVTKNGGSQLDGQEVAQSTLIEFDKNIRANKYLGGSSLKNYFMGIARNQWLKKLRGRKPVSELAVVGEEKEENSDVEEQYIKKERKKILIRALGQIGRECKKLIQLWQLDYSMREIAELTGKTSPMMAKKAVYRCRMRLREFLDQNPGWKNQII